MQLLEHSNSASNLNLNLNSNTKTPNNQQQTIELLQRELHDKSQKLNIAYQASLELVETNKSLDSQIQTLESNLEMMQSTISDYELTVACHVLHMFEYIVCVMLRAC